MKTITHEGIEYVLKSDIEAAFKDRISKLSARAIQAENLRRLYRILSIIKLESY